MVSLVYTTQIHAHDGRSDLAVFYLPNLSHSLPCRTDLKSGDNIMLTIKEASDYFSIGVKSMRRMAEENTGGYAIFLGNHYLIVRAKFEEYINSLAMGEEDTE